MISAFAKKIQRVERALPVRMRLPLRYRVQSLLGVLEPEIMLLPMLLRHRGHGIAVDVGANVGIYTYALSRLGVPVHAFEPQTTCSEAISAWASTDKNIVVHNVGVGASAGQLVLFVPVVNGRPVRTRASFKPFEGPQVELSVPIVTLDEMKLPSVAFIKVDVEGFELEVLQGGRHLLERDRPSLLVEIDRERHTPDSFRSVTDFLQRMGYRCYVLKRGALVDSSEDPWRVPDGIYNFVFLASAGEAEQ